MAEEAGTSESDNTKTNIKLRSTNNAKKYKNEEQSVPPDNNLDDKPHIGPNVGFLNEIAKEEVLLEGMGFTNKKA